MKITVLNENKVYKKNLIAEHGLSLLIEWNNKKILFDVGQSNVFLHNAKEMNIDLEDLTYIILSHGHYDHCGGLEYLNEIKNIPQIYISKRALVPKFSINKKNGKYYFNGVDLSYLEKFKDKINYTEEFEKINEHIFLISNIPSDNDYERMGNKFFLKEEGNMVKDYMKDEQILVIKTQKGLCVFMGCAHMGIMSAINYIQEKFKVDKIYALIAGMHLISANGERIKKTIEFLKSKNIEHIMPCHCTGYRVETKIAMSIDGFESMECGKTIEI